MRRSLTTILLLAMMTVATTAAGREWAYSHLRVSQPRARLLVESALQRSATIRDLLGKLEASDVVTYLVLSPFLSLPTGRTVFMSANGSQRYLEIGLNERNGLDDLVMTLGHELQHALEVAQAPTVRDVRGFEQLYERIGRHGGQLAFETDAAVAVGRRVRKEMNNG